MTLPFPDRTVAGRALGRALAGYSERDDVIVLALPRGGVPVGSAVASAIDAPLDLMLVRKLGTPGQPELAMGAIATGGIRLINEDIVTALSISSTDIETIAERERRELARREHAYRGEREPPQVHGRCVILVDDGVATGATMRVAIAALRLQAPWRIIVAVPVAPPDTVARLRAEADEVVCLESPEPFIAIGRWYKAFPQLDDNEVRRLLSQAWSGAGATRPSHSQSSRNQSSHSKSSQSKSNQRRTGGSNANG